MKEAPKEAESNLDNYDKWKDAIGPVQKEIDSTANKLNQLKKQRDEMEKSGDINSDAYKALQYYSLGMRRMEAGLAARLPNPNIL